MDRRRIARIGMLAAVVIGVTLQHGRLLAWESDVHHTLTQWLALQAGFSSQNAMLIAQGARSYDDSIYTDATGNVLYLCLTGNSSGAAELQQRHLATDAFLPSPPRSRPVTPNSQAARAAAEARVRQPPLGNSMLLLGQALHPLQDSWTHQGVPDVPWVCLYPNLVSAHPEARGGWWRHRADKTHWWVDDVVDTAEATYEILGAYLRAHTHYARRQPAKWPALAPHVRNFAPAASDDEKDAWAVQHLGLPPQGQQPSPAGSRVNSDVAQVSAIPAPRDDPFGVDFVDAARLVRNAEAFFTAWLVDRDIDSAIEWIDMGTLAAQFSCLYKGVSMRTGCPTDAQVKQVVIATLETNPPGVTHWSTRSLARATGRNHMAINRISRAFGLRPYRSEPFKLSPDPWLSQASGHMSLTTGIGY